MSRTRLAHGSLTSLAAALTLLTAGCSGTAAGAQSGGCREDDGWSQREQARWLRPGVVFGTAATGEGAAVAIRARGADAGGPLCRALAVQVEFWRLTVTASGTGMRSVLRVRLDVDGSREHTVGFPAGLAADERDACTGVLVAAYVDGPLTEDELPKDIGVLDDAGTADVTFRTDRIGAYRVITPPDPQQCGSDPDPDQDGTTAPSPSVTANPWGLGHR